MCLFVRWISVCVTFRIIQLDKIWIGEFPLVVHKGSSCISKCGFFGGWGGIWVRACRAGRTSPNHLWLIIIWWVSVTRCFTLTTLNKHALTQVRSCGRRRSSSSSAAVELAPFFLLSYAVTWINISMRNQMISILMFWVRVFFSMFAERFTNRTETYLYLTFVVIPFK